VPTKQSVRVQCLRCGHFGMLDSETLSRLAIAPNTPIAAFVKAIALPSLRQSKCARHAQACAAAAKSFLMCGKTKRAAFHGLRDAASPT
jgi:hypothetical protein